MGVVLKLGGILLAGLLLAACGGGGGGNGDDEAAIEDLVKDVLTAFQDGDATALAGFFSKDCGDVEEAARAAVEQIEAVGEVTFEVTGVDIRNLQEDSAEVLPQGTGSIGDQEEPLSEPGDEPTKLVKEDGEWKIADCGFLE